MKSLSSSFVIAAAAQNYTWHTDTFNSPSRHGSTSLSSARAGRLVGRATQTLEFLTAVHYHSRIGSLTSLEHVRGIPV
jgi:hypothetical protein